MHNTRFKTAGNMVEYNGILWFVSYSQNVLVGYDYRKKEVTDCIELNQTCKFMSSFNYIMQYSNYIVLLPAFENQIGIVDLLNKSVKWLEIRGKEGEYEKFEYGIIWEDRIYVFPFGYDSIISIDINWGNIEYIKINALLERNVEDENIYVNTLAQQGKMVFFATRNSNVLLKMDIEKKSIDYFWEGAGEDIIISIRMREENLIVFCKSGKIYELSNIGDMVKTIEPPEIKWDVYQGEVFEGIGYIYIPYDSINPILLMYKDGHVIELVAGQKVECEWNYKCYSDAELIDGKMVIMNISDGRLVIVDLNDLDNTCVHTVTLSLLEKEKLHCLAEQIVNRATIDNRVLTEGEQIGLSEFVSAV